MNELPEALKPLAEYRQFILYKLVKRSETKTDKLPVDYRTLQVFTKDDNWQDDPNAWTDADTAIKLAALCGDDYGVGFFFTANDPFFFVDIDNCLTDADTWSDIANAVLSYFPGAAVEISQSGTGLHIFGTGIVPPHACKNVSLGLELYTERRFVALTGSNIIGDASTNHDQWLSNFVTNYVPPKIAATPEQWTTEPVPAWYGIEDDDELIHKALQSKSAAAAFGTRASFADLWECNVDVLAAVYPPDSSDSGLYDESSADMALLQHLHFWTGKNCERVLKLMWQSKLVREKWTIHKNYLKNSTIRACSLQDGVYTGGLVEVDNSIAKDFDAPPLKGSPKQKLYAENIRAQKLIDCQGEVEIITKLTARRGIVTDAGFWINNTDKTPEQLIEIITPVDNVTAPMGNTDKPERLTGLQYLGYDQQIELFEGCVYVQDMHRIFTPNGSFLRNDQFNATYGGYSFPLDDTGRKETRKAWEAFTESQLVKHPKVETTCFKPDRPPGETVIIEGTTAVNIYVPINTPRAQGDVTPFTNHLGKVLPIEGDRAILLAYMAACIQHKGIKFQWAPLLQGMEGNGKTLFTRCVAFAIGEKFTHMPPAEQIAEKYNDWLYGTMFIGVEDIYVPEHKLNVIEVLKPMITNDRHAIRAMNVGQVMKSICCNFIFNSNHRDAVRKTNRDRRFSIFYTAQQNNGDLERDGMSGNYFPNLYNWLKNENGYAIVANYLETYQIPDELNPATSCHRAPATSSTEAAIQASLGDAEIIILDAIENEMIGFRGGIIWMKHATELLRVNGKNIYTSALRRVLENIDYIRHPAADASGRIKINGSRERFYVERGHPLSQITSSHDLRNALHEIFSDVARGRGGYAGAEASVFSAPPRTQ